MLLFIFSVGCYRLFSWLARELLDNRFLCLPNAKRCILRWYWIDYIIITSTVWLFALFCWMQWQTIYSKSILSTGSYQFLHMTSTLSIQCSSYQFIYYHSIDFKCNRMLDSIFILTYLCQLKINTANWNVMSFSQPRDSNWLFLDIEDHLYIVYLDIESWPI